MFSWLIRILFAMGGIVTGWFVAEDALNFTIIRGVVTMLLIALIVVVLAFWPKGWFFAAMDWRRRAMTRHKFSVCFPRETIGTTTRMGRRPWSDPAR